MACLWARAACPSLLCPLHQQQYTDNSSHSRNNSNSTQHKVSHCMPPLSADTFSLLCLFLTTFPPHWSQFTRLITKCTVVSGLTKSFFSVSNISIVINILSWWSPFSAQGVTKQISISVSRKWLLKRPVWIRIYLIKTRIILTIIIPRWWWNSQHWFSIWKKQI